MDRRGSGSVYGERGGRGVRVDREGAASAARTDRREAFRTLRAGGMDERGAAGEGLVPRPPSRDGVRDQIRSRRYRRARLGLEPFPRPSLRAAPVRRRLLGPDVRRPKPRGERLLQDADRLAVPRRPDGRDRLARPPPGSGSEAHRRRRAFPRRLRSGAGARRGSTDRRARHRFDAGAAVDDDRCRASPPQAASIPACPARPPDDGVAQRHLPFHDEPGESGPHPERQRFRPQDTGTSRSLAQRLFYPAVRTSTRPVPHARSPASVRRRRGA